MVKWKKDMYPKIVFFSNGAYENGGQRNANVYA
jgi:hypothetical protein